MFGWWFVFVILIVDYLYVLNLFYWNCEFKKKEFDIFKFVISVLLIVYVCKIFLERDGDYNLFLM